VVLVLGARSETKRLKEVLVKKMPPTQYLPRAISLLLVTAQISELVKMVQQITIVHIVASLLLLTIVIATRSGTEPEMH
jgi:hypothetical protein